MKFLGTIRSRAEATAVVLLMGAIATTAAVTYGADQNTQRIERTYRRFLRTRKTQTQLRRVLSLTKDVQTGQRGFLITGKEEYLKPYYDGLQDLRKQIEVVQERLADHPDLLANFLRAEQLITDKIELVQEIIQLKRDQNFDMALQLALSDRSESLMGEVRAISAKIDFDLEQKISTLSATAQERNQFARQFNLIGGVATMVLVVATAAILLYKNHQLRIRDAALSQSNERLAASQKANQDLFYLTAHELKNVLQSLTLSSTITLQRTQDSSASKAAERVCQNVERMSVLIHEILQEAAIASEDYTLDLQDLDLAQLVGETVTNYRTLAQIKEQQLEFTADTPCPISADGDKVRIAIDNLISNAIKYSPLQSTITIRLKRFPDHIILEVIDPGQGFTAEEKARLFSRFPKLAARPTGGELSTGLGLSIAKAMIARHGGTIDAESLGRGYGSRFWIQLPRVPILRQES